ncbi:hypothetical protein TNIN_337721 [Trichonephila inaurata madagascariensis]|uniref:Uncharacterized protein n=1 Tax=Trichonephila inaurata madagascariensis TaxID=2747483 RepID=A0A8X6M7V3_9ARAC|nr:hypothetical protein TNIN_337721 [Trichonephila inaurata madagascariensis]
MGRAVHLSDRGDSWAKITNHFRNACNPSTNSLALVKHPRQMKRVTIGQLEGSDVEKDKLDQGIFCGVQMGVGNEQINPLEKKEEKKAFKARTCVRLRKYCHENPNHKLQNRPRRHRGDRKDTKPILFWELDFPGTLWTFDGGDYTFSKAINTKKLV